MLKKFLVLCVSICLLFLLPLSALALSESEYRELLKDSEFSAADKELNQAWSEAKKNLSPDEFNKLKESQREWVKTVRDESAEELMDFQGYSKVMAYVYVTNERIKVIRDMSAPATGKTSPAKIQTGIVKADKDYITVIAEGYAGNKQKALESAYVDAVRLAVGAIISAKTELNNDELSENIIMHSRGVIEGFDILDERDEGGLTRLHIQAKVHREILQDETKRYIEAQTVKADVQGVVKAQMNEDAKEKTTQAKQKSGAELLREVLEKYGPEDFFSAILNPKIFYDETTKKPYVQITEKFNQSVFWDEFLPKLRNALDGVAVKKTKQFYDDNVRKVNQTLNKQGYYKGWSAEPYDFSRVESYGVVVPDNVASFTAYKMPFRSLDSSSYSRTIYRIIEADDNTLKGNFRQVDEYGRELKIKQEHLDVMMALLHFVQKICRPLAYSITYLDKDGDVISVQIIKKDLMAFMVYRSLSSTNEYRNILSSWTLSFAPGYIFTQDGGRNMIALGSDEKYTIELDKEDLQRLDSMKFEVILEQ